MKGRNELRTWRLSAFILVSIAVLVFFIQRLGGLFFDVVFEICVFYIPAFVIVALFFYYRRKSSTREL